MRKVQAGEAQLGLGIRSKPAPAFIGVYDTAFTYIICVSGSNAVATTIIE